MGQWQVLTALQQHACVEADGKYGIETHVAMIAILTETDDEQKVTTVSMEGSPVDIRSGTEYAVIPTAQNGETYTFVATASSGWNAIVVNGQVARA